MVQMAFTCVSCQWSREGSTTGTILDAKDHAEKTGHEVRIRGRVVRDTHSLIQSEDSIDPHAARKAREAAILRLARDRGLLKKRVG